MIGKSIFIAILTLLGQLLLFPYASAEVFKWVDDKGTIHFTEDESAIPEKYKQQTEKRSTPKETGPPEEKVKAGKKERRGFAKQSANDLKEKQRVNIKKIESDVTDSFENLISLWKNKKYDALYDCGDRKSRNHMAREDFRKRMERKTWELATSWETVRDIQVDVKNATLVYATARIGYRPKQGGEPRIRTETYEMRLENGIWRINLEKVLRSPK